MTITDEMRLKLVQAAIAAARWAHAPYSHYPVGAALLTSSGRVYDGVNVENAAYPLSMCAERVAVFKAVSQGERDFEAIAVVTPNGGSPCGACRQVLAEFGLETQVFIANQEGELVWQTTVGELLPGSFGPESLEPKA